MSPVQTVTYVSGSDKTGKMVGPEGLEPPTNPL